MPRKIHDKGYKRILSKRDQFFHFIQKYVEEASWSEEIKEESLEPIDKEFIPHDFRKREADIIYKAQLKSSEIVFYTHLELQSSVDYTMPFRMLTYMTELQKRLFLNEKPEIRERKDFRLPTIIPIIFYNGAAKWEVAKSFGEYTNNELFNKAYTLDFKYFLIDLNDISEGKLLRSNRLLDHVFLLDKAKNTEELEHALVVITKRMHTLSEDEKLDLTDWIKDVLSNKVKDNKWIRNVLEYMKRGESEKMQYAIERIFNQEHEKGKEEGRLEGKIEFARALLDLLDDETIATRAGLPLEEVKKIRHQSKM